MSRTSLQTPPLSSRDMHRFFSHSLCFPGCVDHNSALLTRSREAEVTSGLTVCSWDSQWECNVFRYSDVEEEFAYMVYYFKKLWSIYGEIRDFFMLYIIC